MNKRALVSIFVFIFVLLVAGVAAFFYARHINQWVRTNNASIDGKIHKVSNQIPGMVKDITVDEGVFVEKGALLASLVPNLQSMGIRRSDLRTNIEEAELLYAQTKIVAPASGYVANLQVKAGEHIAPGQILMSIVNLDSLWIRANISEEYIRYVKIGQEVDIYVDAHPDKVFRGSVASILPAGGSVFSLFPPDAAAGNWVRVAQRIPVKIVFDDDAKNSGLLLRIGMLARVRVKK